MTIYYRMVKTDKGIVAVISYVTGLKVIVP